MEDSGFSTITILTVLEKPKILFLVQRFHIRFYRGVINVKPNLHLMLLHKVLSQRMILKQPEQKMVAYHHHQSRVLFQTPSKGAPKYISQDNDVPEEASNSVLGTVSDEFSDTVPKPNAEAGNPKANAKQRKPPPTYPKGIPSLSEEDLNYRNHWRSVEKNLGSALNGQMYANTEFVKALSLDVSTSFTQLMTKVVYIVSKIIQSEPMPSFRKKLSTPSPTKKKKKKKESLLRTFGPIPYQIDVMDYQMKSKWDNFQSLLWHVHGEREVGDTKPRLYGRNVVSYVTIKKYMILYREILVWYMENVEYPQRLKKWIRVCGSIPKEGNKVYLIGVFKHLENTHFKYHTLSDFETWDCFEDTKADLQHFKESQTCLYLAGWVMFTCKPLESLQDMVPPHDSDLGNDGDNVSDPRQDKGNNSDNVSDPRHDNGNKSDVGNVTEGSLDSNSGFEPAANNSNESGNNGDNVSDPSQDKGNNSDEGNDKDGTLNNNGDLKPKAKPTTSKGAKSSLIRGLEFAPQDQMHSMHTQSKNGNSNKSEQSVQLLNYSLDVTVPEFPLRVRQGFALHDIKVTLKDPDPEILYPIYQIGQKVLYVGDLNHIGLVYEYDSKQYSNYDAYPGYKLFFQRGDGMGKDEWFPFFKVSHVSEQDCPMNRMSRLEQCYSEKHERNSGRAQSNKKGKLLEDDSPKSSFDSDQVSVYDPSDNGHSDSEEDNQS
eukprot:jgi/Psemu1/24557/gm1.24557_g